MSKYRRHSTGVFIFHLGTLSSVFRRSRQANALAYFSPAAGMRRRVCFPAFSWSCVNASTRLGFLLIHLCVMSLLRLNPLSVLTAIVRENCFVAIGQDHVFRDLRIS